MKELVILRAGDEAGNVVELGLLVHFLTAILSRTKVEAVRMN